jgi:hypothetical protein
MRDSGLPLALRIFLWSLLAGVASAYGVFRLVLVVMDRYFQRVDPVLAAMLAVLLSLAVGMASAVTAGVVAGKSART